MADAGFLEELPEAQRHPPPKRVDVTYCYVCSARIPTPRNPPDDVIRLRSEREAWCNRNFVDVSHLDIWPITCPGCEATYNSLPLPTYRGEEAELYDRVAYRPPFLRFGIGRPELDTDDPDDISVRLPYRGADTQDLEHLYQSWLFFGLLKEFLRDAYDRSHYVRRSSDGARNIRRHSDGARDVVVVDPLLDALPAWIISNREISTDRRMIFDGWRDRLHLVVHMLVKSKYPPVRDVFNQDLRCLIATAVEYLSWATNLAFPEFRGEVKLGFTLYWPDARLERLTRLGWCINQANRLLTTDPTLSELALYTAIDRTSVRSLHEHCTRSKCEEHDIRVRNQTGPSHVRNDCKCKGEIKFSDADQAEMVSMLRRGEIPLIKIQVDSGGKALSIVLSNLKKDSYIAISHVWSQGLGNRNSNSLMQCQLTRLYRAINNLNEHLGSKAETKGLIWIDTLCCPISPPSAKQAAIKLMNETYRDARSVLVLDTELERLQAAKLHPIELFARIWNSAWPGRLWTLQEGATPGQLWVQFADQSINFFTVYLALRGSYRSTDIRTRLVASRFLDYYLRIRLYGQRFGGYATVGRERDMNKLAVAVEQRCVWNPDDEMICLASLLGLNMDGFFDRSNAEKKRWLWNEISRSGLISREIAFTVGAKMSEPGCRWAFSTFMQNGARVAFLNYPDDRFITGRATADGIDINSAGGLLTLTGTGLENVAADLLQLKDRNRSARRGRLVSIQRSLEESFHLRWPDENTGARPTDPHTLIELLQDSRKQYALLPQDVGGDYEQGGGICLLVEVLDSVVGPIPTRIRCLRRQLVTFQLLTTAASNEQDRITAPYAGEIARWLPSSQLWCID